MTASSRQKVLVIALCVYGAASLVSMAAMSVGAVVLLTLATIGLGGPRAALRALRAEIARPAGQIYVWASLVLYATIVVSLLVATLWPPDCCGYTDSGTLARIFEPWHLLVPLVLLPALRALSIERRRTVLTVWLVTLGVMSLLCVQQHFTGWPRPYAIPWMPGRFHATGLLASYLSIASSYIFPFFFALALTFSAERARTTRLPRGMLAGVAGLGLAALLLGLSKTLLVSLPLGLLLWTLLALGPRWRLAVAGLALVLALGMAASPSMRFVLVEGAWAQKSMTDRRNLWSANLEFFKRRPLTGVGFRTNAEISEGYLIARDLEPLLVEHWPDEVASKGRERVCAERRDELEAPYPERFEVFSGHAHSNVMDMLGGTGLPGLAAWLVWCCIPVGGAWLLLRRGTPAAVPLGLLCAWFVFHLNGVTQVNFWESKVLHQVMWVTAWTLLWVGSREAP
jgi:O-antigen ligase